MERPSRKTFEVYVPTGTEVVAVQGRQSAVRHAKAWSREQTYPVRVEREDGRVRMLFRDGQLVRYGFGSGRS